MSNLTHHQSFSIFLQELNEHNIRFIFIRGYKYLPEKADTDLDTVIHPDDWEKYKNVCSNLIEKKIIGYEDHGRFKNYGTINGRNMVYYPIFTKGSHGQHLPNKSFRIDSYSDVFFFEGEKGKILPLTFLNYLFNNKILIDNFYVPDDISNILLLVCRNIFDKNGNWEASGTKHTSVIEKLILNINEETFFTISSIIFNRNNNLYSKLVNKAYESIEKPTKMLFLLRKTGLQRHENTIILKTREILEEHNYYIDTECFVTIRENKKFLTNFYKQKMGNIEISNTIMESNDNQCYIFITDYNGFKKNSFEIKKILRDKFPNPDNKNWNYFHSSDSIDDAYHEIDLIMKNTSDFKGIGTYYNQKEI